MKVQRFRRDGKQIMTSTSTANLETCQWCGCIHSGKCPQVKAIEYHPNGSVKRVEFFGPGDCTVPIVVKAFEPTLPITPAIGKPIEVKPETDWSLFRWQTNTTGTSVSVIDNGTLLYG